MIGLSSDHDLNIYRGKGCLSCRNTGYKGRIGIYELLLMDAQISELVLNQEPGYKIRQQARKNGMTTQKQLSVSTLIMFQHQPV